MANVQPILDYSKADATTPWRKQIPGKLLHHFSPTPRFLATALFGKASSKVGRRQRWWNLQLILLSVCQQTWVFLRVKKNMGFFKSQKKLAIKIVFVYSMRISIIHILLFFTVKLSIWSFAFKKKMYSDQYFTISWNFIHALHPQTLHPSMKCSQTIPVLLMV